MVDFKAALFAGKKSIYAMIGLGVLIGLVSLIPFVGFLSIPLIVMQTALINPVLLAYAGYVGAKETGGGIGMGAVAGLFAGLVCGIVLSALAMIETAIGIGTNTAYASAYGVISGAAMAGVVGIVLIFSTIAFTIGGAVFGAAGGFLGNRK